jgi:hypothetical protein
MAVVSLALLVGVGAALAPPLRGLASQIPRSVAAARTRLARYKEPLARIGIRLWSSPTRTAAPPGPSPTVPDSIAARAGGVPNAAPNAPLHTPPNAQPNVPPNVPPDAGPSGPPSGLLAAVGRTFGVTTELLSELIEVLLLALFLLAGGQRWNARLARAIPDESRRRATLDTVSEMRAVVSRYVLVTVLINFGQGILVALAMWALDVPSPLLWGVLTFVLEFVPYFGGLVMVALLLLAGLASGGSLLHALLAPLTYLAITTIQNNVVSPPAYGRGLRLNPAAILIGVMFWYAMWGVAGAFLAVPILAAARILTTRVRSLAPIGPFLED